MSVVSCLNFVKHQLIPEFLLYRIEDGREGEKEMGVKRASI